MLWIQRAEATGEQPPRSVGNNLQMVKDCSPLFDEQVTLFDVYEHNSGQFVWVLVEKTPVTTFFRAFSVIKYVLYIYLNSICLGLARKSFHLAYLLWTSDHFPRIETHLTAIMRFSPFIATDQLEVTQEKMFGLYPVLSI